MRLTVGGRWTIIVAATIAAGFVGADLMRGRVPAPARSGDALVRHLHLTPEDGDDEDLAADMGGAGELWAQHHKGASASTCPSPSDEFRNGCESELNAASAVVH